MTVTAAVWTVLLAASFAAAALGSAFDGRKPNTVFVAILVRNKAHTLPYFFSAFESLDYPKDRMHLWIRSDHNIDNSSQILNKWLQTSGTVYHSVDVKIDNEPKKYKDEIGPAHWPHSRFQHIVELRESALRSARYHWVDYIWFLDCDAFIINKSTLKHLMQKNYPVVAPMLKSDGLYSNFWCGMTDNYYYKRTSDYTPIVEWKTKGCFKVPMIHSSVLIDLRFQITNNLTFKHNILPNYMGPVDDIIIFAMSANFSGIPLHICNDQIYGFITIPLEKDSSLEMDINQLTNIKLEITVHNDPLWISSNLSNLELPSTSIDNMGLDKIFVINLARRIERRNRMNYCLNALGLNVTFIEATDGRYVERGRCPVPPKVDLSLFHQYPFLPKVYYSLFHQYPFPPNEILTTFLPKNEEYRYSISFGGKGKDTLLVETGIGGKEKGLLLVETCYALERLLLDN